MKLFYFPNACSLGIHVLLEEIGKPFELVKVDFTSGAQYKEAYVSLNPKSKVPALALDDGTLVTEWPAIAWYLAKTNPEAHLLPASIEGEVRVLELLDYMIATLHMRGFTRIFRPGAFTPTNSDEPAVQRTGRETAEAGFKLLAQTLGAKAYLLGDFSIADAALFFLTYWAAYRADMTLPQPLAAHLERMRARPAVQRALASEELA
ncbi:glutathione S-transferase N-terminal domain-containing protein [Acidocella sp.]|uniref:glutathione S-transferase N-terminal domain-containing protein n=1 Tax=Acidocella sp. TaxID=50710 RepID=UPI003CFEBC23